MSNEDMKEYVIANIDRAVNEGYIVVYYQPIIRSITGKLCGFEALARWIDPEYGMISPAVFVPALEEANLVYKLDFCILEKVCQHHDEYKRNRNKFFPVSVNLSRQDFSDNRILDVINKNIKKYKVPRNIIHFEITESVVADDPVFMQEEVKKLQDAGFEIWMDDFGSGYSSLNILKDYEFDNIKLDMKFISNNDRKSQMIIMSIIDMAKKIGIKTLAEGVETREQYEFLRSIGCEKIQGYYFGKPMNWEDVLNFIDTYEGGVEYIYQSPYYDNIGSVNVLSGVPIMEGDKYEIDDLGYDTQIPIAIFEECEDKLTMLYYNNSLKNFLSGFRFSTPEQLEIYINEKRNVYYYNKVHSLFNSADKKGDKAASADFVIDGKFCVVRICKVAEFDNKKAYVCNIVNMFLEKIYYNRAIKQMYDKFLLNKYDRIDVFDLNTFTNTELYVNDQDSYSYDGKDIGNNMARYIEDKIYFSDRDKYLKFYDMDTLKNRIRNSKEQIITEYVRIKENLDYVWKTLECIYIGNNKVISTARNASYEEKLYAKKIAKCKDKIIEIDEFKNNFKDEDYPSVNCYWKDIDLKYVDASKSFLEFYGFKDKSEIIGKTERELNWAEKTSTTKKEAYAISTGKSVTIVETESFGNETKPVIISVHPYYEGGECKGVVGIITDFPGNILKNEKLLLTDEYTGLYNAKGLLAEANQYCDEYIFNDVKYGISVVDIIDFEHCLNVYGREFSKLVLREVGNIIRECVGITGVVGRLSMDHFVVITRMYDEKEMDDLKDRILTKIRKINKISDKMFTIDALIEYTTCLEESNVEQMLGTTFQKIAQAKNKFRNGE